MVAYKPCNIINTHLHTVYIQKSRHLRSICDNRCPVDILKEDLDSILTTWRVNRDTIILFIDANDSLIKSKIHSFLQKHAMYDLVQAYTSKSDPATFHAVTNQTDSVFDSPDIDYHHAEFIPL